MADLAVSVYELCEADVPGASLHGRDPGMLTVPELKRWLACRGASRRGRKADLVLRVSEYIACRTRQGDCRSGWWSERWTEESSARKGRTRPVDRTPEPPVRRSRTRIWLGEVFAQVANCDVRVDLQPFHGKVAEGCRWPRCCETARQPQCQWRGIGRRSLLVVQRNRQGVQVFQRRPRRPTGHRVPWFGRQPWTLLRA